jgi:hypothetical protein
MASRVCDGVIAKHALRCLVPHEAHDGSGLQSVSLSVSVQQLVQQLWGMVLIGARSILVHHMAPLTLWSARCARNKVLTVLVVQHGKPAAQLVVMR